VIPKRLVRTVPKISSVEAEIFWDRATRLHPSWDHVTLRDPVNEARFPLTSKHWGACESGAQLADLIRAEELFARGGVYIDSDYEVFQPFDPLLDLGGFAGWEDENHICNAVMGFRPGHLALGMYIEEALKRQEQGTWAAGVGAFTEVLKAMDWDILLLSPGSLYPIHWRAKSLLRGTMSSEEIKDANPWSFGVHHWRHSWKAQKV
jgi:Glycosyltransferase sugar-binding region containing DXD motif